MLDVRFSISIIFGLFGFFVKLRVILTPLNEHYSIIITTAASAANMPAT